jgi:hypothetical protein
MTSAKRRLNSQNPSGSSAQEAWTCISKRFAKTPRGGQSPCPSEYCWVWAVLPTTFSDKNRMRRSAAVRSGEGGSQQRLFLP